MVIIPKASLSQPSIVLGTVILSNDLDGITPILFPRLMIVGEKFLEGIEFGDFEVSIKFLQGLMNPCPHESLDPLGLDLNFVNIGKFILLRAILIGGKLGMGVGRHGSNSFLIFLIILNKKTLLCQKSLEGNLSLSWEKGPR